MVAREYANKHLVTGVRDTGYDGGESGGRDLNLPFQIRKPLFIPTSNTKLWLPLDDNRGSTALKDRSGNGLDATGIGITWVRNTKGIWCASLDGVNDYISLPTNSALNVGDYWTLMAWIYARETTGSIIAEGTGVGFTNGLDVNLYTGKIRITKIDAAHVLQATNDLTTETWILITTREDDDDFEIFYNATSQGSVTDAGRDFDGQVNLVGNGQYTFFKTYLSMLRWFNTAVTDTYVEQVYNRERSLFGV